MHYKTIVLELLRQHAKLHEQLRLKRRLMPALDICSRELKAGHTIWKQTLAETRPRSHPIQIASEALELAVAELEARLPASLPQDGPFLLGRALAESPTSEG